MPEEVFTSLELSGVTVQPGQGGLTLDVAAGEIVVVSGPSGFGGTTLARLIAGHLAPASGQVKVDGRDITTTPAATRPIGFVPVDGGLLPQMSLADNITYGARLANDPNEILRNRVERLVKRLELLPSLALRPHEVSAGQRIRAALARVALRRVPPKVLVVDATAGSRGVAGVRRLIGRVWGEPASLAVLLLTRDGEVADQADRIVWLENGGCAVDAPLAELRREPPHLAIAELAVAGPVAVVDTEIRDGKADLGGGLDLPLAGADGRKVKVLLRTESLQVMAHPAAEPNVRVLSASWHEGTVRMLVEPLDAPGQRWPAFSPLARHARTNDRVALRLRPDRVFAFDAETLVPLGEVE